MANKKGKVENDIKKTNRKIFIIAGVVFLLLVLAGAGRESSPTPEATPTPTPEPTATATPESTQTPAPTPEPPDALELDTYCKEPAFKKGYKVASLDHSLKHSPQIFGDDYTDKDGKRLYHVGGPIKNLSGQDTIYTCYIEGEKTDPVLLIVDGKKLVGSYNDVFYNGESLEDR